MTTLTWGSVHRPGGAGSGSKQKRETGSVPYETSRKRFQGEKRFSVKQVVSLWWKKGQTRMELGCNKNETEESGEQGKGEEVTGGAKSKDTLRKRGSKRREGRRRTKMKKHKSELKGGRSRRGSWFHGKEFEMRSLGSAVRS